MINEESIKLAISEAQRFIGACRKAQKRIKEGGFSWMGCRESGAVRRASMDLTRILADLRSRKV